MSRLKRLIHEIHRRSLWQVLGIYLVGAWIAFQGVEALVSGLGLPEWVPGFAVVLLIVGLPIVLATAFVREGAEAEETTHDAGAPSGKRARWLRAVLVATAGVLVLVAVALWATWPRPLGLLIDAAGVSGPPVDPPLPDEPRIQYLTSYQFSSDVEPPQSAFDRIVFGNEHEVVPIDKPYGVAVWNGRIYVCDIINPGVVILDLVNRQTRIMYTVKGDPMRQPTDIAIAVDGAKYVADRRVGRIFMFSSDDRHVATFGSVELIPAGVAVHGRVGVADA